MNISDYINKLRCPNCHKNEFSIKNSKLICSKCDIKYIVNNEQLIFFENYSIENCKNPIINSKSDPLRHWKTGNLINHLPTNADNKLLLNIGAGNGGDTTFLRKRNFRVITTDLEYNENLNIICNSENLVFQDNTFDYVVMLSVLEHVENPDRLFSEIQRVLSPGGQLIASSAFLEPYHSFSRFHISALGILQLLKSNNLVITSISPGWTVTEAIAIGFIPFLRSIRFYLLKIL